jgi:hypothetical protein
LRVGFDFDAQKHTFLFDFDGAFVVRFLLYVRFFGEAESDLERERRLFRLVRLTGDHLDLRAYDRLLGDLFT